MTLTVGSLFAGIGGIELGLEWTGRFRTIWQIEKDDYARRVLDKHWPNVRRYDDIREVGAHNLAPVDLICGGFPCQDLSVAGKGAGLEGARSGLWYEMLRIITELRPAWAIVENVYRGWRRWVPFVRRDLWSIGYPSMPIRLRACDFGLWHRRDRVFVVAHPHGFRSGWRASLQEAAKEKGRLLTQRDHLPAPNTDGVRQLQRQRRSRSADPSDPHSAGRLQPLHRAQADRPYRTVEPCLGGRLHGVPHRLDRIRALGNAVVPQCAKWIGEQILTLIAEVTQ